MRRLLGPLVIALLVTVVSSAWADVAPPVRVTGESPFAPDCNGAPQTGTVFRNAEVEPWVDANPADLRNFVAVWQQDRWSNGGAQGNLTAFSTDRGRSWQRPVPPPFTRCAGGNAANGGDYERASDPWVSFGPDGTAHQAALALNNSNATTGILVSSSRDGGRTWGPIKTLQRDTDPHLSNDKESITADPRDSRFVYAVWDRLQFEDPADPNTRFSGDTLFTRSTDGGRTWEPTRTILDFPDNSFFQTIGNQIVVLGDGTLVNFFELFEAGTFKAAIQRSTDHGATWSQPVTVDIIENLILEPQGGVIDPSDPTVRVRTGDLSPDIAADPRRGSRTLHVVWQDTRFSPPGSPVVNYQIVISSSTDGGLTWTRPRRVSSNVNTQAFVGSVHADGNGVVGVTYYDFTSDTPGGDLDTDYWFTSSRNGLTKFQPRERITRRPFDMHDAPNAGGLFVGDYEGLTSSVIDRRFVPVYALANDDDSTNPTDVFSTQASQPFDAAALASEEPPAAPASDRASGRGPFTQR